MSATKFQEESNKQSTLNLSSFVGQKPIHSGSMDETRGIPSLQTKPHTATISSGSVDETQGIPKPQMATIASFFKKGHTQSKSEVPHTTSSVSEEINSSTKDFFTNKNNEEGCKDAISTYEKSAAGLDSVIVQDKKNTNLGFFASKKTQKESSEKNLYGASPCDGQKQRTESPIREEIGQSASYTSTENTQNLVDPDFLAALPLELRQEVLSQVNSLPSSSEPQSINSQNQLQREKSGLEKFLKLQGPMLGDSGNPENLHDLVTCSKCNKKMENSVMAEHMDFHFAQELQRKLTWTSDKNGTQIGMGSGQRKRSLNCSDVSPKKVKKKMKKIAGNTQNISHFFNKNLS